MIDAIYQKIKTALANLSTVDTVVDSIATKVDTVDSVADNCYTALGGGVGIPGTLKSIQRGAISFSAGGSDTTLTATISEVTTSKSKCRKMGQSASADNFHSGSVRVELTNSTTVTATRGSGSANGVIVGYEVEEVY